MIIYTTYTCMHALKNKNNLYIHAHSSKKSYYIKQKFRTPVQRYSLKGYIKYYSLIKLCTLVDNCKKNYICNVLYKKLYPCITILYVLLSTRTL